VEDFCAEPPFTDHGAAGDIILTQENSLIKFVNQQSCVLFNPSHERGLI